ncbi:CorA family divalent cation transporter [Sulfurimonas sp. HSL1-6]|uniref:CorA family divalent cation transporter n=1 Tax=Thiomicrolovo immobilis TaxID=3131935 RepID=UPI0031F7EDF2
MDGISVKINPLHLEDLRNEHHPSLFDENPDYDMLIVRLPVIGEEVQIVSTGFILTQAGSYRFDRERNSFVPLEGRFEGPHRVIDPLIDRLLKGFNSYLERVADMEERLYADRAETDFMTQWLGLKRDILRVERVLARTTTVLAEVTEHYEPLERFPVDHYADLHEHTDRLLRSALHQLSKLDYIYNFHNARTNEKMNRLIYLLTVISAIFLPLNLVVGFFGMNTGGLPFAQSPAGTANAVMLMVLLLLLTSAGLLLWHRHRVTQHH